jgi:hypothetical protein
MNDDGVRLQDGLIQVAREEQANVFDDDFAGCAGGVDVCHEESP